MQDRLYEIAFEIKVHNLMKPKVGLIPSRLLRGAQTDGMRSKSSSHYFNRYEVAGEIFVSTRYFGYREVTCKSKASQIVGSVI